MGKLVFLKELNPKGELQSSTIRSALMSIAMGVGVIAAAFGVELPEGWAETGIRVTEGLAMVWIGVKCRSGRIKATDVIGRKE